MKRLLFGLFTIALCWILGQTQKKHYGLYDGCVKKNLYMHESACPGPRRIYFAFHRVLFDCIKVRTKCPRIHKYNEYDTLKKCQTDCAGLMKKPSSQNSTGNGTQSSSNDTDHHN